MDPMGMGYDNHYPMVELDSDPDRAEDSSDDDIDVLLHGTLQQRQRLRRKSLGQKSSSSEDEFEKEMREELDETMKTLEQKQSSSQLKPITASSEGKEKKPAAEQFYDDAYFDSDSDEEGTSQEKSSRKHPVPTDDDLLYDPNIDDENQKWVDKQRQKYQPRAPPGEPKQGGDSTKQPKPLPHSDAVLNCPACMTVLCLDCQRHSLYKNQYRAMFVMNCKVDTTEVLKYPQQSATATKKNKTKRQKMKEGTPGETPEPEASSSRSDPETLNTDSETDVYHPVRCTCCTTEVGVCDQEELYHFFNILASYS